MRDHENKPETESMDRNPESTAVATVDQKQAKSLLDMSSLADATPAEKIAMLAAVTSYVGASTDDVNEWLGKVMPVVGCVVHTATVGRDSNAVDGRTGEVLRDYIEAERVVFKLDNGKVVGFVSMAAASFARDFLLPVFGMGDWKDHEGQPVVVPVTVRQVSTAKGRTFNFQVVAQ